MFQIRSARIDDAEVLLKLAKMVHFVNLPADRGIILDKIQRSRQGFARAAAGEFSGSADPATGSAAQGRSEGRGTTGASQGLARGPMFMFVLEDTESPGPLGTCQILAGMGGPDSPMLELHLEERELYSTSLKYGTKHTVARVRLDASGPTELGGLILQPSFRGHPMKLGRFLSFVRFHFIGLHRRAFADELLAEMMGRVTPDGQNLFWDYFGRRFIPLSYQEADRLCQHTREFMISLLPKGDIYVSLLQPEARAVMAEVGPETVPARRMLEKLGFRFTNCIDPFDGGPNLRARTDDVPLVRGVGSRQVGPALGRARADSRAIVSVLGGDGEFRAVNEPVSIDSEGRVCMSREAMLTLGAEPGMSVGVSLADGEVAQPTKAAVGAERRAKPRRAAKQRPGRV